MSYCPACQSGRVVKNGHVHNGKQRLRCKDGGRQFVPAAVWRNRQRRTPGLPPQPGTLPLRTPGGPGRLTLSRRPKRREKTRRSCRVIPPLASSWPTVRSCWG